MNVDAASIAYGVGGLSFGVILQFLWRKKADLEQRCEFLDEFSGGLSDAFSASDALLASSSTPAPIRRAVLFLLSFYADKDRGILFAETFVRHAGKNDTAADGSDPISQAMSELGRFSPALARQAHQVLANLCFGLVFLNLADSVKVERVQDEAARDPVSLWARIAGMLGASRPGSTHLQHA